MPVAVPVTLTEMVQPPAGCAAPLAYATVLLPALAVTDASEQVPPKAGGAAMRKPDGRVSVKALAKVAGRELLLPSVKMSVLVFPASAVVGLKVFDTVGAAIGVTTSVAVAGVALLPNVVCSAPAATVLVTVPRVEDVMLTAMLQPTAGTVAPLAYVTELLPTEADATPGQVVDRPLGFAVVTPAGKVSRNSAVKVATELLVLLRFTTRVLVRSEERRVGKECNLGCRSRWSPYH